jgi:cellobiose-specific phosphotransferase system component IIA
MVQDDSVPKASGFHYSALTQDDLNTISEAEQKISRNHNSHQVLIAYENTGGTGQTGTRS